MPIYAYKCSACGFAKDVLQKLSDAPLSVCPSCEASAFGKQLTAAGFQLKGSGWYVTDFRDGGAGKSKDKATEGGKEQKAADGGAQPASPSGEAAGTSAAAPAPAPGAAPAAAPAASPAKGD